MPAKRVRKPSAGPRAVRASVTLPPGVYGTLRDIARQKKVSAAWVIRDAVEKYIAEQWPLFGKAE